MADRQISVNRAFNSVAGDGSGEERYFTAGNANEIEDFVSADEFAYRQEVGDIIVVDALELPPKEFVRPTEEATEMAKDLNTSGTPRTRSRRSKAAADSEE